MRNSGPSSRAHANQRARTNQPAEPHGDAPAGGAAPKTVRWAAAIAIVQSIAVICFGIFLAAQDFMGGDSSLESTGAAARWVGVGSAVFIFIVFGFVIAASIAMSRGHKWGRGAVVLIEIILAACSFQMMSGGAVALGIVTLVTTLAALYLLMFAPAPTKWFAARF